MLEGTYDAQSHGTNNVHEYQVPSPRGVGLHTIPYLLATGSKWTGPGMTDRPIFVRISHCPTSFWRFLRRPVTTAPPRVSTK